MNKKRLSTLIRRYGHIERTQFPKYRAVDFPVCLDAYGHWETHPTLEGCGLLNGLERVWINGAALGFPLEHFYLFADREGIALLTRGLVFTGQSVDMLEPVLTIKLCPERSSGNIGGETTLTSSRGQSREWGVGQGVRA